MKRNILLLIVISLLTSLLSGCIPAALIAGAAVGATAGGAIIYDQRSLQVMHQDQKAQSTAQYNIDRDPSLIGRSHIRVSVFNRVALLVGQTQTAEQHDRAYQIVRSNKNIDRVYNQIEIEGAISIWL